VPQPPFGEQPGAGIGHRPHDRFDAAHRDSFAEALQPRRRRAGVDRLRHLDLAAFGSVLLGIAEHVAQRVTDLAR
jgi:hypothetical protein